MQISNCSRVSRRASFLPTRSPAVTIVPMGSICNFREPLHTYHQFICDCSQVRCYFFFPTVTLQLLERFQRQQRAHDTRIELQPGPLKQMFTSLTLSVSFAKRPRVGQRCVRVGHTQNSRPQRNLRVADTYASLTDARPFRKAYTERQAREHLLEWTGLEFDPRVVRALLSLEPFKELKGYGREEEVAPDLGAIADELMVRAQRLSEIAN